MEWLAKPSNAIEYIEDNLDKEISYEESRPHCVLFNLLLLAFVFLYVAGVSKPENHLVASDIF